jgi:hypothetical protein
VSKATKRRRNLARLTILVCLLSAVPYAIKLGVWLLEREQAVARYAQVWQPLEIVQAYQRQIRRLLPGAEPDNPPTKPLERKPPSEILKQPEPAVAPEPTKAVRAKAYSKAPPQALTQTDFDRALELGPLVDANGQVKSVPPSVTLSGPELRKELAARVDPKSAPKGPSQTELERVEEIQKQFESRAGPSGLSHSIPSTILPEDAQKTPLGTLANWAYRLDPKWFAWLGPLRGLIFGAVLAVVLPIQTTYYVGKELLTGDAPFYGIGVMVIAVLAGVRMIRSPKIEGFWKTLGFFWLAFFSVVGCCSIVAWLLQAFLVAGVWHKILVGLNGLGLEGGIVGLVIGSLEGGHKILEGAEATEQLGLVTRFLRFVKGVMVKLRLRTELG